MNETMYRIFDIAIVVAIFALATGGLYWVCVKFFEKNKYVLWFVGALLIICIIFTLVYFVQHDYAFHIIKSG